MKKWILAFLIISMFACNEDDTVLIGVQLLEFEVEATGGFVPDKTYIDTANAQVNVFTAAHLGDIDFPLTLTPVIEVSQGASISPASGASVTFNNPEDFVKYTITAEDGVNTKDYIFTIRDNQIPNAGFESWFNEIGMNAQPFLQPGKHMESTVWATANMGTSIYSIYGTTPIVEGDNTMVKVETVTTIALPIVASALYLGKFDLDGAIKDPTNPVAAAKLGIPFYKRPSAVKFKYSYKAGDQMVQAVLKDPGNLFGGFDIYELEGTDKFMIEAILEKRDGDQVATVGQVKFIGDTNTETMVELKLVLEYLSEEEPTHFSISFSPSLDGGTYKGAVGSALIIDDLEILYE